MPHEAARRSRPSRMVFFAVPEDVRQLIEDLKASYDAAHPEWPINRTAIFTVAMRHFKAAGGRLPEPLSEEYTSESRRGEPPRP